MATQTIVTLIDSIDGKSTEDVQTVTFFHPMTGQKMTIELNAANRKAMGTHLERMNKYFDAAEPVVEAAPVKPKAAKNTEITKIREWARQNGFAIGDRGRISAEIMTAYEAAQEQIVTPEAQEQNDNGAQDAEPDVVDTDVVVDDAELLKLMAEVDAETHGDFSPEDVAAKVDATDSK